MDLDRSSEPLTRSAYVRHAHADWLVGRLYGKVMPSRLRKYLRRSVAPEVRNYVRGQLRTVVGFTARLIEPVRGLPMLLRRQEPETIVRWRSRSGLAVVVKNLTPVEAMRRNLGLVREALEAEGVPYFVIPGARAGLSCIGVPEQYRDHVARGLVSASQGRNLYVRRIEHRGDLRLATRGTIRAALRDDYFRIAQLQVDESRCMVLDEAFGCDVEFWRTDGSDLFAPRPNRHADSVPADEQETLACESTLTPFSPRHAAALPTYPTRRAFSTPPYSEVAFPIDVVYTWVDGMDPAWQERRAAISGTAYHPHSANMARFVSHDELRYSIRSVRMNMPWVRTIYLVTDQQIPDWLELEGSGLVVIDHREIFSDVSVLPTFNSHAIESQLHHIDGLSEHFLYLNDDVCIGEPLRPSQFFFSNGMAKYFPSPALVPFGDPDPEDIPSSVAGKNNRRLIWEQFGVVLTHKMKHAPHPLRRSVLAEIEERFPAEHRRTARNKFRDITDISVASSLHHYYAYHTGRAVPGTIRNAYIDLAAPGAPAGLRRLLAQRNRQVFCLNETTGDADVTGQRSLVSSFLQAYFPVPSIHEKEADLSPPPSSRTVEAGDDAALGGNVQHVS